MFGHRTRSLTSRQHADGLTEPHCLFPREPLEVIQHGDD
jgi:hypothetical protein